MNDNVLVAQLHRADAHARDLRRLDAARLALTKALTALATIERQSDVIAAHSLAHHAALDVRLVISEAGL